MVENMHDVPYISGGVGPEITSAMTLVAAAVKLECDLPVGIQILAGADFEALAVAHVAGLDFIRAECFAFAHVADEGLLQSNAAKLAYAAGLARLTAGVGRHQEKAFRARHHLGHQPGRDGGGAEFLRARMP